MKVSPLGRVIWLAEVAGKDRSFNVTPKLTAQTIIAVTRDKDTLTFLTRVGHPYTDTVLKLKKITEDNKRTKVIRNFSHYLPVSYVEGHPSILWAPRDRTTFQPALKKSSRVR